LFYILGSIILVILTIVTVWLFLKLLVKINTLTKYKGLAYFSANLFFLTLLICYLFVPLEIYKILGIEQSVNTFYIPFVIGLTVSIFTFRERISEISKLKF